VWHSVCEQRLVPLLLSSACHAAAGTETGRYRGWHGDATRRHGTRPVRGNPDWDYSS
jgi:hypothetical protein